MALGWKLVVDAADPYAQAVFWAAALEYEVEDNSELIERLLGHGVIDASVCREVGGRRYFREAVAVRHPDDPVDAESGVGLGRRLLFQQVPEAAAWAEAGAQEKNRLHVDVHTGPEQRDAKVTELTALGAAFVRHVREPQGEWSVLRDPENNVFCVA